MKQIVLKGSLFCFAIFFIVLFSIQCATEQKETPSFNTRYAQEAMAEREIPQILSTHPRLLLRTKPWNNGPSLEQLKTYADSGLLKNFLKAAPWDPKPGTEWAFRYLLTGNESLVQPIIDAMKKDEGYWDGYLYHLSLLYDWLYNSPSFTPADRKIVEDKMIRWTNTAMVSGEEYSDMWSHFGYRAPLDIAAAGLALYGHRKEAVGFIAAAGGYMKKNMFRGWALNSGAWQGGWAYYGQGPANLFKFVALWSSATSENLYEVIDKEQNGWVRGHLDYLMYTMYPDKTPVESTGFNYAPDQRGGSNVLLMLARAYADRNGAKNIEWRNEWGWQFGIDQFLYYHPSLRDIANHSYTMPLSRLWGRNGIGYVQMRSGWTENDTVIEFKCGDYFWSHQFQNQNAFTIYHKGRQAIQSGAYAGDYYGYHALNYYRPAIGSNTILVVDPNERTWIPPSQQSKTGMALSNGYFPEYGGQRTCYQHPAVGSAETCFTFDKYLARKKTPPYFETGDIRAYETTDHYSYVYGDATMAYNNPTFAYEGNKPKLDLFTRQMVFLDKKYILLFDRVNSLNPEFEKKWLLHSIGEPRFGSKLLQAAYPSHEETYDAGTVLIENGEGALYIKTLFANEYITRKIGGSATVSEARPSSSNQGNAALNTLVRGTYERVSPTIASDAAQPEEWTIEFKDSEQFTVRGSKTGFDGEGTVKDMFLSKSQAIFIPRQNWQGLAMKGDSFVFSVKSASHRFRVNSINPYPPPKSLISIFKDASHIDPGNWRIEVMPRKKQNYDTFMHFLYPSDRGMGKPPAIGEIVAAENTMRGAALENWIVLFGSKGQVQHRVAYTLPSSKALTNHLLVDMVPGKSYLVTAIAQDAIQKKVNLTASAEGTLFFSLPAVSQVVVEPIQ